MRFLDAKQKYKIIAKLPAEEKKKAAATIAVKGTPVGSKGKKG